MSFAIPGCQTNDSAVALGEVISRTIEVAGPSHSPAQTEAESTVVPPRAHERGAAPTHDGSAAGHRGYGPLNAIWKLALSARSTSESASTSNRVVQPPGTGSFGPPRLMQCRRAE